MNNQKVPNIKSGDEEMPEEHFETDKNAIGKLIFIT